jgi:hypothetical protein
VKRILAEVDHRHNDLLLVCFSLSFFLFLFLSLSLSRACYSDASTVPGVCSGDGGKFSRIVAWGLVEKDWTLAHVLLALLLLSSSFYITCGVLMLLSERPSRVGCE